MIEYVWVMFSGKRKNVILIISSTTSIVLLLMTCLKINSFGLDVHRIIDVIVAIAVLIFGVKMRLNVNTKFYMPIVLLLLMSVHSFDVIDSLKHISYEGMLKFRGLYFLEALSVLSYYSMLIYVTRNSLLSSEPKQSI
jgi:hypothetical protein